MQITKCLLILALTSCSSMQQFTSKPHEEGILHVDFEQSALGDYDRVSIEADFDSIEWALTKQRGHIVSGENENQFLRVSFPKGSVGPEQGGIQFVRPLKPAKEYYLTYDLYFEEGFDFSKGGKLPGLTSGGATYTGGVHPDEGQGWSARYMWVANKPIVYLYYKDMAGKYGESLPLNAEIKPGNWYTFTQHIRVNQPDQENALIEVWINGQKVGSKENFALRKGDLGLIDSFYFSTFHGGATADWAPQTDSYIRFDNFRIYSKD
ncbi:MAG: polysaccharide lyase [Cyclobacteriaceae bacterium]